MFLPRVKATAGRLAFLACASGLCMILAGCTSIDEDHWKAINEIGVQSFAQGNYQQALESFDLALTHRSQDPILLYNCAQCYDRLGDTKRAEQFYTYCLQLDAKHGDVRLALLSLYYRTGRAAEAKQQIQDWLKQEPKSADPYVADAWRLRQEKAYPLAQARLQQALSIDSHSRRALDGAGPSLRIPGDARPGLCSVRAHPGTGTKPGRNRQPPGDLESPGG